jgi:hypothetical protein
MWSAVEIRDADATKRVGREGIAGEWVRTTTAQAQFRDGAGGFPPDRSMYPDCSAKFRPASP